MRSTCSASLGCLTMSTVDTTSLSLHQVAQHPSVNIVHLLSDNYSSALCLGSPTESRYPAVS